jgi:hypothetical protein
MPEEPRRSPVQYPPESAATPQQPPKQPAIPYPVAQEFGTARKNLPPTKIILIGLGAVLLVGGVISLVQMQRQPASGSIDNVVVAPVTGQKQVLVGMAITLQNHGRKPYVIRDIKSDLSATPGNFSDDAAAAVDFGRYFQAFPILQQGAIEPLKRESRIEPGGEAKGMIIVSFPVTADEFTNRKSVTVTISGHEQAEPLVLTK